MIKDWGPQDQQQGIEIASALYGALAQLIKEGKRSCVIDTGSNQTPQGEIRSAFIICGGKNIDVTISKFGALEAASVTEYLQAPGVGSAP